MLRIEVTDQYNLYMSSVHQHCIDIHVLTSRGIRKHNRQSAVDELPIRLLASSPVSFEQTLNEADKFAITPNYNTGKITNQKQNQYHTDASVHNCHYNSFFTEQITNTQICVDGGSIELNRGTDDIEAERVRTMDGHWRPS